TNNTQPSYPNYTSATPPLTNTYSAYDAQSPPHAPTASASPSKWWNITSSNAPNTNTNNTSISGKTYVAELMDVVWLSKVENQKWDVESRIVESGKVWGDDEDPEIIAARREDIKLAKRTVSTEKKQRLLDLGKDCDAKKAKKVKGSKGKEKKWMGDNRDPGTLALVSNTSGIADDDDLLEDN
ncbi:hypothetical protein C0991_009313, partial [Blastosporella zonata]